MTLEELASGTHTMPLTAIGGDRTLTRELQDRLATMGLLDPPADGNFGPVSLWALREVLRKTGTGNKERLDAAAAETLLNDAALALFPLNTPDSAAGRIVRALQVANRWISRHPDCFNIVYVEGMDSDFAPNSDEPNQFNDLRLVLRINRAGNPEIVDAWEATSEPGSFYTLIKKLDPDGAARIAFGQYKAWCVGMHPHKSASAHEALVQTAPISVHRDLNEDFERSGDEVFEGLFGINQHWGYDMPKSDIGKASAGCLVGRTKTGHKAFMSLCKSDPRFMANNGYRFLTTVMPASDVAATD